jgi:hypothetical protein
MGRLEVGTAEEGMLSLSLSSLSLSLVPVVAAVILVVFRPDYTHADDGDSMA